MTLEPLVRPTAKDTANMVRAEQVPTAPRAISPSFWPTTTLSTVL